MKGRNCILCALCNAAPPFFSMCDSPESFENQQNNSNDRVGGGKKGGGERETDVRRIFYKPSSD